MNTLNLEITPRISGRVPQELQVEFVRALSVDDLVLLEQPRGETRPPLKRLMDRHHALARSLASGLKPSEAALVCNYSVEYVGLLKGDPTFRELVEFYRGTLEREMRSNFERLSGLAADAADILSDRMETEPEKISTGQLIEIVKTGADRSGNGPQSSSVQLNINANLADRLKSAREQARAASEPVLIEGKVNERE